eukprot:TRINITY_DN27702_c0_g1_i1.p1 TRINITY_DN27702_c0_g1~~TRINITY_DN27702_c0_g1_i1.p1  ORF type:complete len:703 (+),score=85.69 TRINITY_DN27702_c0_g1_i1:81-2111(+)
MSTPRIAHIVSSWRQTGGRESRGIGTALGIKPPIMSLSPSKLKQDVLQDARRVGIRTQTIERNLVITPPTSVMPPKRLLGYHGDLRVPIRDISSWYRKTVTQYSKYSKRQTYSEIKTFEEECGLLTTLSRRPRVMGDFAWHSTNFLCNEIEAAGRLTVADYRLPSKTDARRLEEQAHKLEGRPFYSVTVSKTGGISHQAMVFFLCRILRISPEDIGCMELQTHAGYTTQRVLLPTDKIKEGYLSRVIGQHVVENGCMTFTDINVLPELPPPPQYVRCCVNLNSISDVGPADVAHDFKIFSQKGLFANLFDPTDFNAVVSRPVPLWVVAWHLYRMDDCHVVFSLMSHYFLSKRYSTYKKVEPLNEELFGVIQTPAKEWYRNKAVASLKSHIHASYRKENDRNPIMDIRCVIMNIISYVNKSHTFKGVVKHLIDTQPDVIGGIMCTFHKLVWNILASERLALNRLPIHGDVIIKNGEPFLLTDKESAKEADMQNVVLPLSKLLTTELSTSNFVSPQHRFSTATAQLVLRVFGLQVSDIDRWHHILPLSFRNTVYRRVIGTTSDFEYIVGKDFLPLLEDAAFSKQKLKNNRTNGRLSVSHLSKEASLHSRIREVSASAISSNNISHAAVSFTTRLDASPYSVVREFFYPRITRLMGDLTWQFEVQRKSKEGKKNTALEN